MKGITPWITGAGTVMPIGTSGSAPSSSMMVLQIFATTLMAFRDGIAVFRQAGALPGHALDDLIGQIRDLDMDEVRKQIDAAN